MPRDPQLSLYLIVGNEAPFIGRCLDAFRPLADEIVVCIARGSLPDDGTEEIARARGATIVHYQNDPAHRGWNHVDHFAKARQTALDACQGRFAFWVDADDLPAPGLSERLSIAMQALSSNAKLGIYGAVYAVLNAKLTPVRERMVKRLLDGSWSGRWHYAVHEALLPVPGYDVASEQHPWVEHHPGGYKPASAERNIRILESQLTEAGKYAYYLQQELFLSGRRDQSAPWSHVAALWPSQEKTLRYESWCNYGAVLPSEEQRMAAYGRAHQSLPGRREALYFMAREQASAGRWGTAFHLLKAAMVQPDPGITQWNAQRQIYDFECIDLYLAAARSVGDTAEASKIEAQWRAQKPIRISVCHATRGRAQQAIDARTLWMKKAADPASVEWLFATDEDDSTAALLSPWGILSGSGGCVAAWNRAARQARGDVLIQASDDWDPPLFWDKIILQRLGDTSRPAVLAVSDGHRTDQLLCLAILTRKRWEQQGHLFAPEYDTCSGIFSDNEFTARAYADGCVVEARDVVFAHNNPLFTGAPQDEQFKRHNAATNYTLGQQIFTQRNPVPGAGP
jgi:hypothetical protein